MNKVSKSIRHQNTDDDWDIWEDILLNCSAKGFSFQRFGLHIFFVQTHILSSLLFFSISRLLKTAQNLSLFFMPI